MAKLKCLACTIVAALVFFACSADTLAQDEAPLLTLVEAVHLAEAHNRQLSIASLGASGANNIADAAATHFLPVLKLSAVTADQMSPVNVHFPAGSLGTAADGTLLPQKSIDLTAAAGVNTLISVTAAQPITQIEKIRAQINVEKIAAATAVVQVRAMRSAVVFKTEDTYYNVVTDCELLKSAEAAEAWNQQMCKQVRSALAAGTALRADLMSATAALANSQADVSRFVGQQRIDKMKLNETLGRSLTTQFTVSLAACALPMIPEAEADHNPTVEAALLFADQAQQKKRVITAGYWPDISLALSYYQLTTAVAGLPSKVVLVGLQASWDPFDWGERRLEARAADAAFRAAKVAYRDALAQHEIAIATARQSINDVEMYVRAARLAADAADEGLRVATNEYRVSAVPLSRLLEAHKRDISAQADLVTARLAVLRAQNALSLQLGSTTP